MHCNTVLSRPRGFHLWCSSIYTMIRPDFFDGEFLLPSASVETREQFHHCYSMPSNLKARRLKRRMMYACAAVARGGMSVLSVYFFVFQPISWSQISASSDQFREPAMAMVCPTLANLETMTREPKLCACDTTAEGVHSAEFDLRRPALSFCLTNDPI